MLKHYQTHGLRLGTRGSPLALWQAKHAAARIKRKFGIECEIVKILTYADTHKGSLQNLQHKGVFVSAIQKSYRTALYMQPYIRSRTFLLRKVHLLQRIYPLPPARISYAHSPSFPWQTFHMLQKSAPGQSGAKCNCYKSGRI